MAVKIIDCHIANCGTGIKADGKIDMQVEGTSFAHNGRDIDLSITHDSNVILSKITTVGAKLESINITEYRYGIDAAKERIAQLPLSSSDREFVFERIKLIEDNKDAGLLQQVLKEIMGGVKSIAGNVVANIIASQIFK